MKYVAFTSRKLKLNNRLENERCHEKDYRLYVIDITNKTTTNPSKRTKFYVMVRTAASPTTAQGENTNVKSRQEKGIIRIIIVMLKHSGGQTSFNSRTFLWTPNKVVFIAETCFLYLEKSLEVKQRRLKRPFDFRPGKTSLGSIWFSVL